MLNTNSICNREIIYCVTISYENLARFGEKKREADLFKTINKRKPSMFENQS